MPISVVIPVLNEERLLPTTLRHTASLGFHELIVVDGGSRDHTRDIVAKFSTEQVEGQRPRVSLLAGEAGRARQMNVGAAACSGDILLFLHADTLLPREARAAIEEALADPVCIGGRFDVRFDREKGVSRLISRLMNVRSRWTGIATGDQAIFIRRQAFDQLGGFPDIPLMEDVEFSRCLKRVGRIAALRAQVITSFRRWEAQGPWRTILLMWAFRFLYWAGVSPHRLVQFYRDER